MKKITFERKLTLKKEKISTLQPGEMANIKGGDDLVFLSIVSCKSNERTCGENCCTKPVESVEVITTCPS